MANYQAKLDFIVSGQSKIDRLISSASQLDSIVQNLSKSPLDINVQRATSQLDKFDTELKALKTNISNADKQIDTAVAGVNKYTTEIASLQSKLSQLNPNTVAYNKVLEKQNAAIKNLAQSKKDLAKAGADLESFEASLGKATKNVKAAEAAKRASEALSNLADDYLRVGRAQDRGVSGKVLKEQLEPTIAQLGAQAEVLKLVASNSRIASSEFNRFAIASQVAGQKIFEARQKQLGAIAFGLSPSAPKVNIGTGGQGSIAAARNQVQELINLYPGIVKSEAALSDYSNQLKRLQSLVPYTSREFSVLENVIAELNDEIANIGLRGQKSAITLPKEIKPSGPVSTREGTLKDRQDYAEAVNKEYQKQLDLIDKIDRSILGISSKEEFLNQVYRANSELSEHNLEIAQKMTIEINRQVGKMVRSQKSGGTLVAGIFGQDFMPVSGRIPGVGIEPGSPADKQRTVKAKLSWQGALAQMDELAQQIKQTADAKGSKIKMDWNLALEKANEILSDATLTDLQAGTKAATKLGQQRLREIERTTADLWKGYGGPALPPGFTEKGRITPKATGQFSPIEGQRRLTNIVESGAIIQQGLINLQRKGADVTDRLVQLETALNNAKQDGYEISQRNLDVLNDEVASAGRFAQLQRQILAGQTGAGGRAGGKSKSGYEAALTTEQARAKVSEIVKGFNAAVSSNPDTQSIGGNIASSFAKNLKDGASSAASAATSFASAALAAIKKVFGIASPSRVMKEIAANLISSFITELVSNIPSVKAALEQTFNPKSAYEQAGRAPARRPGMAMELDPGFVAALSGSPLPSGASTVAGSFEAGYTRPQGMGLYRMQQRRFPTDLPAELSSRRNRPSDTSKVISESIKEYRAAVDNFWDGEDSSFDAVKRVVVASARLSAARLSRTLQQSRTNSFDQEFQQVADEARSIINQQGRGTGNTRQTFQRISDSILNSVEAFAYTVSESFGSAIDRARGAIPRAVEGIASALDVSGYFGGRMGGGGGRPPAPPAPPAGPSNDDLRRALTGGNLAPLARATSQQLGILEEELTNVRNSISRTNPLFDQLTNQIQTLGREQERRAPGATFLTRRLGPRTANAISEGLIGGAFPLLFGQGIGASAGGLVGGAAGGFAGGGLGFGLSLLGTALGGAFDTAIKSGAEMGAVLNDTAQAFEKVKEKALFSSKETETLANKLQEAGLVATASALAQQEIINKVGSGGVKSLKDLGTSSDRLNRAWAEFNLQLQAALAGPMADLLNWVASIVEEFNRRGREEAQKRDTFRGLSTADKQLANAEIQRRVSAAGVGSMPPEAQVAQIDQIRAQVLAEFAKKAKVPVDVEIKNMQILDEQIAVYSKRLESIDIGKSLRDQVRQAAREQQDIDKQRADLVSSYEESIANIRKNVEDEISNRRFDNLSKENDIIEQQSQNRLKSVELEFAKIQGSFVASGQETEYVDAARQAAEIVAGFVGQQLSAEAEAAKIKRDAALEAKKLDYEAASFKANIEKEVSRLNIETARKVAEINDQIARKNEEINANRFQLEKKIAELQLRKMEEEAKMLVRKELQSPVAKESALTGISSLAIASQTVTMIQDAIKELKNTQPPARLAGIGGIPARGVSTTGLDREIAKSGKLLAEQIQESLKGLDLTKDLNVEDFRNQFEEARKELNKPIDNKIKELENQRRDELKYIYLVAGGVGDVVAEKTLEIEKEVELKRVRIEGAIAGLEASKNVKGITQNNIKLIDDQIAEYRTELNALGSDQQKAIADATALLQPVTGTKIAKAYGEARDALADLATWENVGVTAAQSIGDAFGNAFKEIVAGTSSTQEILAGFFQNLANSFSDMASQMIADMIKMILYKQLAGLFTNTGSSIVQGVDVPISQMPAGMQFANGGIVDNLQKFANGGMFNDIKPFASGGMVSSPTLFKFADGGTTQNGVMGEAGPEAILPLSRGSDGKLGVSASGGGTNNVTVNVDASGSKAQGDSNQANQLGSAIAAAVQDELIKQKRPGGLLA